MLGCVSSRRPLPAACGPPEDYVVIEDTFNLHGVDNGWSRLVDDATAADKAAAYMPSNHTQWAAV